MALFGRTRAPVKAPLHESNRAPRCKLEGHDEDSASENRVSDSYLHLGDPAYCRGCPSLRALALLYAFGASTLGLIRGKCRVRQDLCRLDGDGASGVSLNEGIAAVAQRIHQTERRHRLVERENEAPRDDEEGSDGDAAHKRPAVLA